MCFENRVLSKILGLRWSKKETEGSYITSVMFCSSDQILFGWANQDNEMDGIIYCVCVCGEKRNAYRVSVEKREAEGPLEGSRHR